jgi:hypothetical protein
METKRAERLAGLIPFLASVFIFYCVNIPSRGFFLPNVNKTHSSKGFYRADIDGMRALAVCLVIAAHLHLPHLGGGFVGVDVFFVISGYLISAILVRQLGRQHVLHRGVLRTTCAENHPCAFCGAAGSG